MSFAPGLSPHAIAPRWSPWPTGIRTTAGGTIAALTLIGAIACGGDSITSPSASNRAPRATVGLVSVAPITLSVCKAKSSPAGVYTFTLSGNSGSSNTGDIAGPSPFSLTVPPSATTDVCTIVFTRTQSQGDPPLDPPATFLVTEAAAPGTTLANITVTNDGFPPVIDIPNRRVTLSINAFHSEIATFFNVAAVSTGCTFTQGYYKNKGANLLPAGNFFTSGKTYLTILNTPPKGGDAYLILAHQYIAASLNVAGGASAPAAVTDALATSLAYFQSPTTSTLTRDQLIALSNILDAYNNGLTGPGHCD